MTRPSSQMPSPPALCPPPRMDTSISFCAAKVHRGDDVCNIGTTGDQPRVLVDHAVVDFASAFVLGLFRLSISSPLSFALNSWMTV